MFALMNLDPAGFFVSRANLIGFTDQEIEFVNAKKAAPERVREVEDRLGEALHQLLRMPAEGRTC